MFLSYHTKIVMKKNYNMTYKTRVVKLFFIVTTSLSFLIFNSLVFKLHIENVSAVTIEELEEQISKYKKELEIIEAQKKSLTTQIANNKKQISSNEQQIDVISQEIELQELEIESLQTQIASSEDNLKTLGMALGIAEMELKLTNEQIDKISQIAEYQTRQIYKKLKVTSSTSILNMVDSNNFLNSKSFDEILTKKDRLIIEELSRLKTLQDQKTFQIQENKSEQEKVNFSLNDQKQQLETAKASLEQRKSFLANQIEVLGVQISTASNQQGVLSEKEKQAESLLNQYESELIAYINSQVIVSGAEVKKGDIVGYQGNTGNSTGEHLHFTVILNGTKVNPCKYLPASGIVSNAGMTCNYGNGTLGLPELRNPIMTQEYSNSSLGYYHDGIDIVGPRGNAILAAHDGYIQRGKYNCIPGFPIACNNGGANYVRICEDKSCTKGFTTIYIHLRD